MVALPLLQAGTLGNEADSVTDDGTMVAGGNAWWKTSGQTGSFGGGTCSALQAPLRMVDLSADGSVAAGSGAGGLHMFGQQAPNAHPSTPAGTRPCIRARSPSDHR